MREDILLVFVSFGYEEFGMAGKRADAQAEMKLRGESAAMHRRL